jgi:PGAP2IP, first transmembrane domain
MVFFYPCVKMGYTGWELMYAVYWSPVFLGLGSRAASFRAGAGFGGHSHAILRVLSIFLGLGQFQLEEREDLFVPKFILCAVGLGCELVAASALWMTSPPSRRERSIYGYAIGLILYNITTLAGLGLPPGEDSFPPLPVFSCLLT